MTVKSRTYTVTLDASDNPEPLTLIDAAVGFTTTRWVVITNLTPFIMELEGVSNAPENEAALAPGTANKYQWSNQYGSLLVAQWVNPIAGTAPPSTPQVIVQYSDDPTGADLVGSYPVSVQGGVTIGTLTGAVTIDGPVTIDEVTGTVTVVPQGASVADIFSVPPGSFTVLLPTETRTVIIQATMGAVLETITNIEIQGNTTGFIYFDDAPYVQNTPGGGVGTTYFVVAYVPGFIDGEIVVTITTSGGATATGTVYWDADQYNEEVFYNGDPFAQSAGASLVILGPARLLTAQMSLAGGGSSSIRLNGTPVANIQGSGTTSLDFPANTLLRTSADKLDVQNVGGGTTVASVITAYP